MCKNLLGVLRVNSLSQILQIQESKFEGVLQMFEISNCYNYRSSNSHKALICKSIFAQSGHVFLETFLLRIQYFENKV